MKAKNIFNVRKIAYILSIFCLGLVSCTNNENEFSDEAYFSIEENPTGISADIQGLTQTYIVRSNRPWKIESVESVDWVKAFPAEGEDDGTFKFIVDENVTFDARNVNFSFVVDGKEQPVLFRIDQIANIPFIVVDKAESGIAIPSAESSFSIEVSANVDWTYAVVNGSWLSEVSISENEITLLAEKNRGEVRSATVNISAAGHPSLDKQIIVTQSPGDVILEESFDWVNYGSTIFYTTSGETRMDSWTVDELARGWTSTENEYTSNQKVVYARTGFVKLGKTGYGGDLISPKLSELDEPTNLRVTFKAVPYKTKGGTEDDNTLNISVIGSGETSVSSYTVNNWPDYDTDPDCTEVWKDDSSSYEFTITGANADTQLKFLGGDYYLVGVGKGKNRIFIDDIKVTIVE